MYIDSEGGGGAQTTPKTMLVDSPFRESGHFRRKDHASMNFRYCVYLAGENRMRHKEEMDRRRAEMERDREAVLSRQAEAKQLQVCVGVVCARGKAWCFRHKPFETWPALLDAHTFGGKGKHLRSLSKCKCFEQQQQTS